MFLQASVPAVVEVEVAPLFPVGCEGGRGSPQLPKELSQASSSPLVASSLKGLRASALYPVPNCETKMQGRTSSGAVCPARRVEAVQAFSSSAQAMMVARKGRKSGGHG